MSKYNKYKVCSRLATYEWYYCWQTVLLDFKNMFLKIQYFRIVSTIRLWLTKFKISVSTLLLISYTYDMMQTVRRIVHEVITNLRIRRIQQMAKTICCQQTFSSCSFHNNTGIKLQHFLMKTLRKNNGENLCLCI